ISSWMTSAQAARVLQRVDEWHGREHGPECAELFLALSERLEVGKLPMLIAHAARLCSERAVSDVLCAVAPLLRDEAASASAFATAGGMRSTVFKAQALAGLLVCLDERQQVVAVSLLANVVSETERLRWLTQAIPDLKPSVRQTVLEE